MERFGRLDILVNNAATNPYMGRSIDIDLPRFDKTWQVNYRGPVVWCQEAWRGVDGERARRVRRQHRQRRRMSVETHIGHYNVTKAALIHLTRTLAADLAPGVRVNAIAPGLVKTDMARALWEPAEEAVAARMPLRRLGEPVDIANAALFLASDLGSWITGQTLVVDGGALLGPRSAEPPTSAQPAPGDLAERRAGEGLDQHQLAGGGVGRQLGRTAPRRAARAGGSARSAGTTRATTRWPHSGSVRPTTATSATPGQVPSTRSTAAGHTFSPPVMIRSSVRPNTRRRPAAGSHAPASPVAYQPSAPGGRPTR